ncbi:hypothetical protein G9A89_007824 [Geosiphon pyriformis]|nr:hypothetical protein G9A89_007824 [Geosiphon pyriformis]
MTQQSWRSAIVVHQPIPSSSQQPSGLHQQNSGSSQPQNPNFQNYLSLLVTPEDASTNNPAFTQKQPLTSNIPPATITEDELLATIFLFEFEKTAAMPLFSGAALEAKPITVMYTDAKVEGQSIKLILDSGSTGSIITRQLMDQLDRQVDRAASTRIITADGAIKTPISKIDDFPFKINGIMTPIKVLRKRKQKEKHTWETDDLTWTDNNKSKPTSSWEWEEDKENKGKEKEEETTQTTTTYNTYTIPQQSTYRQPKLICVDCGKKLSSMGACCGDNEEYSMATKFYCHPCIFECFERPKRVGK